MDILSQLNKICDQDAFLELKPKSKIPVASDWPNQGKHLDEVTSANGNLGLILGSTSGILDVDLDCREAKVLADLILPVPHAVFDRGSDDSGHHLYRASSFGPRKAFNAEGSKSTLVELRGDRAQTMVPPSSHPNGSKLVFTTCNPNAEEVTYEGLLQSVNLLAACTEIAQNWTDGMRHDLSLAFSGLCVKTGIEPKLLLKILQRICDINGDLEVDDRISVIRTSYAQPADSLLGYKGLVDCLGQSKAKRIADRIAAYSGKEFSSDIAVMEPMEGDLVNFGQFSDRSNVTEARVGTVFSRWLDGKAVYVVEKKQWMIWNGNYWEADQCTYIKQLAYQFVQEAKAALVDLKSFTDATNLSSFESVQRLENISKFAAIDRAVKASEFDTDPFVLATKGKWIDLKTGQPSNPNPDVLVSKALSVGYSPEAKCPIFLNFLNDVFESDQELISFVQQAI